MGGLFFRAHYRGGAHTAHPMQLLHGDGELIGIHMLGDASQGFW